MLTVVPGDGSGHEGGKDGSPSLIDEIVREGARRMLAEALQARIRRCSTVKSGRGPDMATISPSRTSVRRPATAASAPSSG